MRSNRWWLAVLALLLLWPAATAWADDPDRQRSDRTGEPVPGRVPFEVPAWNFDDGKTFVNQDVTVEAGEVFAGPLGIFDGSLTVEAGGAVNGDVFVSGGDAEIAGQVNGNLAVVGGDLEIVAGGGVQNDVFGMDCDQDLAGLVAGNVSNLGGSIVLRSSAIVNGTVLSWPDVAEREPGAQVGGAVESLALPELPKLPVLPELPKLPAVPDKPRLPELSTPEIPQPEKLPTLPAVPPVPRWERPGLGTRLGELVGRVFGAVFLGLILLAVGALVVLIWPRPTQRVADCMAALPARSLGLGLLTFLIAVGLEVLAALLLALISVVAAMLMATVILIPVGLLLILLGVLVLLPVPLALAGGMVLGWVALAELLGRKVLGALKVQRITPLGAVVVGLLLTIPVVAAVWVLEPCCLVWPVLGLLTSAGLGAVLLTRFGSRPCLSARGARPAPAGAVLPPEAMDEEAGRPDVPPGQ